MPVSKTRKSKSAVRNRKRVTFTGTDILSYVKEGVGYIEDDVQTKIYEYLSKACYAFKGNTAIRADWCAIDVALVVSTEIERRGVVLKGLTSEITATTKLLHDLYARYIDSDRGTLYASEPLSADEADQLTFFAAIFRMQVSSLTVREYSDTVAAVERQLKQRKEKQ